MILLYSLENELKMNSRDELLKALLNEAERSVQVYTLVKKQIKEVREGERN